MNFSLDKMYSLIYLHDLLPYNFFDINKFIYINSLQVLLRLNKNT